MGHQPQRLLADGPLEGELLARVEVVVVVLDLEGVEPGLEALGVEVHEAAFEAGIVEVRVPERGEGGRVGLDLVQLGGGGEHAPQVQAEPAREQGRGERDQRVRRGRGRGGVVPRGAGEEEEQGHGSGALL